MSHPHEGDGTGHRVVVNDEGQHSLWPAHRAVPDGWRSVFGPAGRAEAVAYVERSWPDMRPAGLVAAMNGRAEGQRS
ncbi:MbtH family protein [Streptomyces sp. Ru73]|uniref:MbtH family protein n=1 Tax=Streptomyces sp. Ru73 TaxID=2080748 RepID=UPI000CDDC47B|nr:MbtH family protein [Streptomyces sp. Ru73]POX40240.1 MbtH family protein [Streptomyces sp. Ru73]